MFLTREWQLKTDSTSGRKYWLETYRTITPLSEHKMNVHGWIENMKESFNSGFYGVFPNDFADALKTLETGCIGSMTEEEKAWVEYARNNLQVRDASTGELTGEVMKF